MEHFNLLEYTIKLIWHLFLRGRQHRLEGRLGRLCCRCGTVFAPVCVFVSVGRCCYDRFWARLGHSTAPNNRPSIIVRHCTGGSLSRLSVCVARCLRLEFAQKPTKHTQVMHPEQSAVVFLTVLLPALQWKGPLPSSAASANNASGKPGRERMEKNLTPYVFTAPSIARAVDYPLRRYGEFVCMFSVYRVYDACANLKPSGLYGHAKQENGTGAVDL